MFQPQLILFAGTADGRRLGETLAARGVAVLLCVATDYGRSLALGDNPPACLQVRSGRMDAAQMRELISGSGSPPVVDATHPYAREATVNIRAACRETGAQYLRLTRPRWDGEGAVSAADMREAARILDESGEKALLTVGSKELAAFTGVRDYRSRLYPRVLPTPEVLAHCAALGFGAGQVIAMQGPFSHALNVAMIRERGVGWLVTKDSGETGGFYEKRSAAAETGAKLLVVRRPADEEGLDYPELLARLCGMFGLEPPEETSAREQPEERGRPPHFPLFIDLYGKRVLVIGGGRIAARRVKTLLEFGAGVTVVSPELCEELRLLYGQGAFDWTARPYEEGDLAGALVAIAAADDPGANARAAAEARERGVLISTAHDRGLCTFWFPATLRGGGFTAGIVSESGDHAAVRRVAEKLREEL